VSRPFLTVNPVFQLQHFLQDNILVTNHGIPYITDFGISKVLGDHPFWKTNTRTIQGSVRWMSPELLQEAVEGVTVAGDVYAFGITSWACLPPPQIVDKLLIQRAIGNFDGQAPVW
jgi:serine/threonine protein kinase